MKEYFDVLERCLLFEDIGTDDLEKALKCSGAFVRNYEKAKSICSFGDKINKIGIVVKGQCHMERIDISGNRTIILKITEGKTFGETIGFSGMTVSPISVVASTNCSVVFVPIKKVVENLTRVCAFSTKLIENLIKLMAQKSLALHIKTDILSQKTTREKLMSYFEYETETLPAKSFRIPFNREELADYLSVNRSAMTRELFRMQEDGLIEFDKKTFKILKEKH